LRSSGALQGAIRSGGDLDGAAAGAIGAVVGETVAELVDDGTATRTNEKGQQVTKIASIAAQIAAGLAGKDTDIAAKTADNAIENNFLISAIAASAAAYTVYAGDGDPIEGLANIGKGDDPLSEAIVEGTTEAVKLSYKHYPEETRATLEVLGELGGAADALVTYVDEATGNQVSYQWNALDEKTRNQILGAGKLISAVIPAGTVSKIAQLKKLAKTGENVVNVVDGIAHH
jgi:filamentous hemagglutinin